MMRRTSNSYLSLPARRSTGKPTHRLREGSAQRLFLKSGFRLPGELLGMSGGGKCGEEEEEDLDAFFSLPGSGKQFSILANAADWWQSNHKSFLSSFADENSGAFANARSDLAEVRKAPRATATHIDRVWGRPRQGRGGGLGCSRSGRDRSERGSSA